MKITLVRSMARSAVFELVNSGCYRAPAPYTVSLDGATVCEGDTNVFSLYSMEPGRSYTLAVTLDGVTDTLDFTTAEESFFVDASRYGLVADGVTDNTAKLQAALSTCPAGGTVYVPAGTYRTQSLFLQSSTTLYLEKGCTLLGGTNRIYKGKWHHRGQTKKNDADRSDDNFCSGIYFFWYYSGNREQDVTRRIWNPDFHHQQFCRQRTFYIEKHSG